MAAAGLANDQIRLTKAASNKIKERIATGNLFSFPAWTDRHVVMKVSYFSGRRSINPIAGRDFSTDQCPSYRVPGHTGMGYKLYPAKPAPVTVVLVRRTLEIRGEPMAQARGCRK